MLYVPNLLSKKGGLFIDPTALDWKKGEFLIFFKMWVGVGCGWGMGVGVKDGGGGWVLSSPHPPIPTPLNPPTPTPPQFSL